MSRSPVQIAALEIENVKRIKAVRVDCSGPRLTVIGGGNGQGKTSGLDSIAFALGGKKFQPTDLKRDGAMADPEISVTLSNGVVVKRSGKKAALKVTDPEGRKAGQALLNEFVSAFALDLPRFLDATTTEKAKTLLQVIGVEEELIAIEREEQAIYDERHAVGQIKNQKEATAKELIEYADVGTDLVSASELIKESELILGRNGVRQQKRNNLQSLRALHPQVAAQIEKAKADLVDLEAKLRQVEEDLADAEREPAELEDESTTEIESKLEHIEEINVKVRHNLDKARANEDAEAEGQKYDELSVKLEAKRAEKLALLEGASLPLPGLGISNGELTYKAKAWDCMSGSEQLQVAAAIVRRLNPRCGFVLIDKLEALDADSLQSFSLWLEAEGLQAITTRVSKGDECSIVIEDGLSMEGGEATFVPGEF